MKFKGTIIITDPCYIIKDEDWDRCDCGGNVKCLGFENCICEDTIYGDWTCFTYKGSEPNAEIIRSWDDLYFKFFKEYNSKECRDNPEKRRKLHDNFIRNKSDFLNKYCYGEFCADTGQVAVFNLDEVRKYNPDIDDWIASHKWCATIISDFDGEVEYQIDDNGDAHIVGIGNIDFYTTQSGF